LSLRDQSRALELQHSLEAKLNGAAQSWGSAELDALMPAILDRAFKGEL
jgi:hypothetical protein